VWTLPNARRCSPSVTRSSSLDDLAPIRVGVFLTGNTNWEEIQELVTDSHRILAPRKLSALRD